MVSNPPRITFYYHPQLFMAMTVRMDAVVADDCQTVRKPAEIEILQADQPTIERLVKSYRDAYGFHNVNYFIAQDSEG